MLRIEVKPHVPTDQAYHATFRYDPEVGRFGLIILLGAAACASPALRSVPRVVDGRIEQGPFVSPYAYEWFIEGEMSAAKGQHGEAAMAFESAAAAPADDDLLISRLAEEYEFSGATRRADRSLTLARRFYPNSARVALAEGRVLRNRGNTIAALASFARAEDLSATWDEPVVETARTLFSTGHSRRATAILLERLESSAGTRSEYVRRVLIDLARRAGDAETLERALSPAPESTSSASARAAASLALQNGSPALAARILAQSTDTAESTLLWLRAVVESGGREDAASFLATADSERLGGPLEHVDLLLDIGEVDLALRRLDFMPPSPTVNLAKGRALLARGEFMEAANVLSEVPLGTASFEAARLALAECSMSLARQGAAAETLSQAPHASLAVRAKLAEIYLDEGDLRAGLRLFDPKQAVERATLAKLFERAGRFDEAAAYYATLRVLSTDEPRLRARASAEQLATEGDLTGAATVLADWIAVAPEDLHARVRLVELLLADARGEAADAEGRRALGIIDDPLLRAHLTGMLEAPGDATH